MAYVPDQLIGWRFKDTVQCYGEFHNTKAGTEVSSRLADGIKQEVPEFVCKFR